jgi:hypothetical protein
VTSYELNTATVTGGAYFHNYWDGGPNRVQIDYCNITPDTTDTYTFVYDPTAGIPAVVEELLRSATPQADGFRGLATCARSGVACCRNQAFLTQLAGGAGDCLPHESNSTRSW